MIRCPRCATLYTYGDGPGDGAHVCPPLADWPEVRELVRQAVLAERAACAAYLGGIAPTYPDPVAVRFLARRLRERPAP